MHSLLLEIFKSRSDGFLLTFSSCIQGRIEESPRDSLAGDMNAPTATLRAMFEMTLQIVS